MKSFALLLLRISVGLLIVWWGLDKIVNPAHGLAVSDRFYSGLLTWPALMPIFGGVQIAAGLLFMAGLFRRVVDPVVLLINAGTMVGVWRSIVDPWGWVLEGTNALFYPSLTIFAASLLLLAIRNEETLVLDRRRSGRPGVGRSA